MTAVISTCGRYRYRLERAVPGGSGSVAFIMLNPSTADATADDPTIRRCIGFAFGWGHERLIVGNVFGWRSTDPKGLKLASDPVGPENDAHIKQIAADAALVVCAWGSHAPDHRVARVLRLITEANRVPHALKLTKAGAPGHPLYLRGDSKPFPWGV